MWATRQVLRSFLIFTKPLKFKNRAQPEGLAKPAPGPDLLQTCQPALVRAKTQMPAKGADPVGMAERHKAQNYTFPDAAQGWFTRTRHAVVTVSAASSLGPRWQGAEHRWHRGACLPGTQHRLGRTPHLREGRLPPAAYRGTPLLRKDRPLAARDDRCLNPRPSPNHHQRQSRDQNSHVWGPEACSPWPAQPRLRPPQTRGLRGPPLRPRSAHL